MDYYQLAKEQFSNLREEVLDDDHRSVGAENSVDYEIDGQKFSIFVDGCWEKSTWFNYTVFDEDNNVIASGDSF